ERLGEPSRRTRHRRWARHRRGDCAGPRCKRAPRSGMRHRRPVRGGPCRHVERHRRPRRRYQRTGGRRRPRIRHGHAADCERSTGPRRHPDQQCRCHLGEPVPRPHRDGVGPRRRCQPQRPVPVLAGSPARDDRGGLGAHHQHRLGRREDRRAADRPLLSIQVRGRGADSVHRAGVRRPRHHRQRHLPRHHDDRDDATAGRAASEGRQPPVRAGMAPSHGGGNSARPTHRAGRRRGSRSVSCLRRRRSRLGPGDQRQRRTRDAL
ncbi:MAG: 3-oxoacyl-[acyl-carrier protein] reductase, partial [uncultured Nocardioidaceae bacterium]